ncbi:DgyrCDS10751 [Dimorphilus gyrociliatus]|uniref:DgyrCDS10751 n=1 Tax=Dimorphilus gyrociliatus TaxID=2664684 RepID=A0A7I8W175_9ANNE|nr:DgyrCDS10751 [Dimorphilus gyrociliatus]
MKLSNFSAGVILFTVYLHFSFVTSAEYFSLASNFSQSQYNILRDSTIVNFTESVSYKFHFSHITDGTFFIHPSSGSCTNLRGSIVIQLDLIYYLHTINLLFGDNFNKTTISLRISAQLFAVEEECASLLLFKLSKPLAVVPCKNNVRGNYLKISNLALSSIRLCDVQAFSVNLAAKAPVYSGQLQSDPEPITDGLLNSCIIIFKGSNGKYWASVNLGAIYKVFAVGIQLKQTREIDVYSSNSHPGSVIQETDKSTCFYGNLMKHFGICSQLSNSQFVTVISVTYFKLCELAVVGNLYSISKSPNLAIKKPTYFSCSDQTTNQTKSPSFAVDGFYSTYFSLIKQPTCTYFYWAVSLLQIFQIDAIVLVNKAGSFQYFINNLALKVTNMTNLDTIRLDSNSTDYQTCQTLKPTNLLLYGETRYFPCSFNTKGMYVIVEILNHNTIFELAEIEVFGSLIDDNDLYQRINELTTVQSSFFNSKQASGPAKAVDGDASRNVFYELEGKSHSCSRSLLGTNSKYPWWMITTEKSISLKSITIVQAESQNTDDLLSYFEVTSSYKKFSKLGLDWTEEDEQHLCAIYKGAASNYKVLNLPCSNNMGGYYHTIRNLNSTRLTLCEVYFYIGIDNGYSSYTRRIRGEEKIFKHVKNRLLDSPDKCSVSVNIRKTFVFKANFPAQFLKVHFQMNDSFKDSFSVVVRKSLDNLHNSTNDQICNQHNSSYINFIENGRHMFYRCEMNCGNFLLLKSNSKTGMKICDFKVYGLSIYFILNLKYHLSITSFCSNDSPLKSPCIADKIGTNWKDIAMFKGVETNISLETTTYSGLFLVDRSLSFMWNSRSCAHFLKANYWIKIDLYSEYYVNTVRIMLSNKYTSYKSIKFQVSLVKLNADYILCGEVGYPSINLRKWKLSVQCDQKVDRLTRYVEIQSKISQVKTTICVIQVFIDNLAYNASVYSRQTENEPTNINDGLIFTCTSSLPYNGYAWISLTIGHIYNVHSVDGLYSSNTIDIITGTGHPVDYWDKSLPNFCAKAIMPINNVWHRSICNEWKQIEVNYVTFRSANTLKICELNILGVYLKDYSFPNLAQERPAWQYEGAVELSTHVSAASLANDLNYKTGLSYLAIPNTVKNPYWGVYLTKLYAIQAALIIANMDNSASAKFNTNLTLFSRKTFPNTTISTEDVLVSDENALCFHYEKETGFIGGESKYFKCDKVYKGRYFLIMQMEYGKYLQLAEVEVYGTKSNSYYHSLYHTHPHIASFLISAKTSNLLSTGRSKTLSDGSLVTNYQNVTRPSCCLIAEVNPSIGSYISMYVAYRNISKVVLVPGSNKDNKEPLIYEYRLVSTIVYYPEHLGTSSTTISVCSIGNLTITESMFYEINCQRHIPSYRMTIYNLNHVDIVLCEIIVVATSDSTFNSYHQIGVLTGSTLQPIKDIPIGFKSSCTNLTADTFVFRISKQYFDLFYILSIAFSANEDIQENFEVYTALNDNHLKENKLKLCSAHDIDKQGTIKGGEKHRFFCRKLTFANTVIVKLKRNVTIDSCQVTFQGQNAHTKMLHQKQYLSHGNDIKLEGSTLTLIKQCSRACYNNDSCLYFSVNTLTKSVSSDDTTFCNDDLANSTICSITTSRSLLNVALYKKVTSNSSINDKYFNENHLTDGSLSLFSESGSCSKFNGLNFQIVIDLDFEMPIHSIAILNSLQDGNVSYRINLLRTFNDSSKLLCKDTTYDTKNLTTAIEYVTCSQQINRLAKLIEIINLQTTLSETIICEIEVYTDNLAYSAPIYSSNVDSPTPSAIDNNIASCLISDIHPTKNMSWIIVGLLAYYQVYTIDLYSTSTTLNIGFIKTSPIGEWKFDNTTLCQVVNVVLGSWNRVKCDSIKDATQYVIVYNHVQTVSVCEMKIFGEFVRKRDLENLAKFKPTFSYGPALSTTSGIYGHSSYMVDGSYLNERTTLAIPSTWGKRFPYLTIDLVNRYLIYGAIIITRFDNIYSKDFHQKNILFVGDTPPPRNMNASEALYFPYVLCHIYENPQGFEKGEAKFLACQPNVTGRYFTLIQPVYNKQLQIAEMEVYGQLINEGFK